MKRNVILIIILFTVIPLIISAAERSAVIDGYCFLEDTETYEGTKVLFTAVSPSAVTDSTFTNEEGYYQISINEGIYTIEYSNYGWQPFYYTDVILLNDTNMDTVTLEYGIPIDFSGEINGILTNEYIYHVVDDIIVNENEFLTIEPGVTLRFADEKQLTVNGTFTAEGTVTDSIIFTSDNDQPVAGIWHKIEFYGANSSNSTISYCKIEYSEYGITCTNSSPTITSNTISDNSYIGITCTNSSPIITSNTISDNIGDGIFCTNSSPTITSNTISDNVYGNGINCTDSSSPNIISNSISDNAYGIRSSSSSPNVISNSISNNGYGIICYYSVSPTINGNTISNNDYGIYCNNSVSPTINGNTISNNDYGIYCTDASPESILGNILYDNSNGFYGDMSTSEVVYNLFWMSGAQGEMPNLFGEIFSSNFNGDPCDIYCNLFMDPLFADPELGDFHLTAYSPCIDAGNPDPQYYDPDGTIADMGAFSYYQAVPGHHYGDVDDSGDLEAFDASLVLQYFCLLVPEGTTLPWEEWRITIADVDGNSTVESYDASLIMQYAVGYINSFPVENR